MFFAKFFLTQTIAQDHLKMKNDEEIRVDSRILHSTAAHLTVACGLKYSKHVEKSLLGVIDSFMQLVRRLLSDHKLTRWTRIEMKSNGMKQHKYPAVYYLVTLAMHTSAPVHKKLFSKYKCKILKGPPNPPSQDSCHSPLFQHFLLPSHFFSRWCLEAIIFLHIPPATMKSSARA